MYRKIGSLSIKVNAISQVNATPRYGGKVGNYNEAYATKNGNIQGTAIMADSHDM